MKDSQDWLDEIVLGYLRKFDYNNKYILPFDCHIDGRVGDMLGESLEEYNELMELYGELKSAIREHFLKEALEMINNMEYDDEDFTITPVLTKLEGKFNDKYKED